MKSQFIIPGMIFSLVDRRPVTSTDVGTLPIHFYLVISAGSEACLQDIQCMSITSMRNKDITYELPVVVNDTVSYVVPYNIVSFRKDDIQIQYYRGFLVGHPNVTTTEEFLKLCRDTYTDALYGDIDKSIKDRIQAYQKAFLSVYKDVPRYEGNKFSSTPVISRVTNDVIMTAVDDVTPADNFDSMLKRIDSLPHVYTQWSPDDIFSSLLFFSDHSAIDIVSRSNRYKSAGTLDNVKRTLRRIVKEMRSPIYSTVINGHEYNINFITRACHDTVATSDLDAFKLLKSRIEKAMR